MCQYMYKQEGNITHLRSLLLETFAVLGQKESEPWANLRSSLAFRLTQPGVANEICVLQTGILGCSRWIGVGATPTSRIPQRNCDRASASLRIPCYEQNAERYLRRVLEAVRQTLELAGDEGRMNEIHGCGQPISPMFRSQRGRKFARFEDRGTGRVASFLAPNVSKQVSLDFQFRMP